MSLSVGILEVVATWCAVFVSQSVSQSVPHAMPATFAEAKAALLPILRNRSMPDLLRLTQACANDVKHDAQAALPFSEDTLLMLAYDTEHAVQPITASMLKGWGVSSEECLAVALDNLRERTAPRFDEVVPGVFVSAWNDSYDTSRLLFPDIAQQLDLGGDPVMMIPTRGRMLVTASVNVAGIMAMAELAQRYADEEGCGISALMYRFHKGRAVQHVLEEPVAAKLKVLQFSLLTADYASQKQLLDKFHERKGIDIYVASCQLMQGADGAVVTMGVWTEGVSTLLPKTAIVVLNRLDGNGQPIEMIAVAWDELMNKTGALKLLDTAYPPRYRTTEFPPKAVRDTLVTFGQ